MNKYLKKIKHLRTTVLEYANERSVPGYWTEDLVDDFDFVEHMELLTMDKIKITPKQMRNCNKLYRKYSNV